VQTSEKTDPAQAAAESLTPYLDALEGEAKVATKPPGVPEFDSSGAPLGTDPSAGARGMSAIRAQSKAIPKTGAPASPSPEGAAKQSPEGAVELQDSYRVRTARGLTYDFSGRDAMLRWLGGRQDLHGCEVAEPGKDWVPAGELLGVGAAGSMPVVLEDEDAAYIPEPGESVPGGPDVEEEAPRKTRSIFPVVMWVAVSLSVIVLLFTAAATLTRYGVVNLSSYLPLSWVGVEFPGEEATLASEEVPGEVVREDPEKAYKNALNLAKRSIRSKRFSKAALEYNRALTIRPDSVEALKGLAKAYNGLGDRARALAVLKKAKAQAQKESAPKKQD
jgi:hypothetical protein